MFRLTKPIKARSLGLRRNFHNLRERFATGSLSHTAHVPFDLYFSFATLTHVGYGDVYSVHRVARSLTTGEALIGQL